MVTDDDSGQSIQGDERTSSGMFLDKAQDEIVAGIEARIAALTFFPEVNGEAIQMLRYEHGQKYEPHFYYFGDEAYQQFGDN
ncbi:probable prolyl 4-hydroxylase 7 [Olea europaea var. sylvestris]|uniref:probable prolyl 4-hydroxylase 7 n=1 Tax=Olea europaea var. sylvestris TaxID=158386 RepID=UPI000C1D1A8B|nr:probable prolyl 4-hydroxylase 7 [Olea europaea var. sylvestris]XP_022859709.1 probable prolyl 4-hydroxylase 7 [Olea europaea var. sylvestris]XP_022859710.1 probable prolyl 4-hydroxylase 7 [Olea europaea var. sylvestris]